MKKTRKKKQKNEDLFTKYVKEDYQEEFKEKFFAKFSEEVGYNMYPYAPDFVLEVETNKLKTKKFAKKDNPEMSEIRFLMNPRYI